MMMDYKDIPNGFQFGEAKVTREFLSDLFSEIKVESETQIFVIYVWHDGHISVRSIRKT